MCRDPVQNAGRSDELIVFLKRGGGHIILRQIELQSVICWFTCEGLCGLPAIFVLCKECLIENVYLICLFCIRAMRHLRSCYVGNIQAVLWFIIVQYQMVKPEDPFFSPSFSVITALTRITSLNLNSRKSSSFTCSSRPS